MRILGPARMLKRISGTWRGMAMRRTHQHIIDAAMTGEVGRLVFAFYSAGQDDRTAQIFEILRRIAWEGRAVRVVLNPQDAKGLTTFRAAEQRFRTWSGDASVPAGEFQLAISRVQWRCRLGARIAQLIDASPRAGRIGAKSERTLVALRPGTLRPIAGLIFRCAARGYHATANHIPPVALPWRATFSESPSCPQRGAFTLVNRSKPGAPSR